MNLEAVLQWFMGDLYFPGLSPYQHIVLVIATGYLLGYVLRSLAELAGAVIARRIEKLKGRAAHV